MGHVAFPMEDPHPIERGIALLRELILEDPAARAEFEASRAPFFGPVDPRASQEGPALIMAERRHLEWFCLERSSAALGDLPFEALIERWRERADADERGAIDSLRQALTGVFEVRDVDPGRGLWLHDLLGLGAFPVAEAEASAALAEGDVLAGRIYPLGDAQFRLSPAVAVFRNPALLEALRRDLATLRQGRRGTLRIAQGEIERMFFHAQRALLKDARLGAAGDGEVELEDVGRAPDPAAPRALRQLLVDSGMAAAAVDRAMAELAAMAVAGEPGRAEGHTLIRGLLAEAAFASDADLRRLTELAHEAFAALADQARRLAVRVEDDARGAASAAADAAAELGSSTRLSGRPNSRTKRARAGGGVGSTQTGGSQRAEGSEGAADVAGALANFDAARAKGADLDQVFAQLERDLGLDDDSDEDPGQAPDFPGVLGAIVQEFLWEVGLVEGEGVALGHRGLMRLAAFGEQIGVFENFGPEHLLEFIARWSIERGHILSARQAQSLLESLEKFCRWIEEQHHSPLWTMFERTHAALSLSLPRIAAVNDVIGEPARAAAHGRTPAAVVRDGAGELGLLEGAGSWSSLEGPANALAKLEAGDWVAWRTGKVGAEVLLAYPPEAASLLRPE